RENLSKGFFYVVGRAGPLDHGAAHVKVYLNLSPHGAPGLVEALLMREGVEKIAFEAKLVNDPAGYCRVDTGLVYVEPKGFAPMAELLLALARESPSWFREGTPIFTRKLANGIAVAESPRMSAGTVLESFGQHRCRLVAEAIWPAISAGEPVSRWVERVAAAFAKEGLSLDEPWVKELALKRTRKGLTFEERT